MATDVAGIDISEAIDFGTADEPGVDMAALE
jgi:hypothetical protein